MVQLRARVGMVFQKPNPFPKSIYENVAYGPRIHGLAADRVELDEIVHTSLRRAGLWEEVKDRLSHPGTSLSGGQQQRLCIARTIAVNPEVILMDEPCSALDPIATARIEDLIDELRESYAIVIVTHSMQQAARVSQRTARAFVYLAVILDAFSRKAVGWALENTLDASLAVAALETALDARKPQPGSLIHHSDRGVQYASIAYRQRLAEYDITISMSRPGNPFDNAKAESFMKTLKTEEINGRAFADIKDARRRINGFIAEVYNKDRLHSALGYQSPLEFETAFAQNKAR